MARIIISNLNTNSDNLLNQLESWEIKAVSGSYGETGYYNTPETTDSTGSIRDSVFSTLNQVDDLLGNLRAQIGKEMYNMQNKANQQTTGYR
ncbi:hypothetical protein I8752_13465 [Nostocaceae cyanobacterium CENA369]|uniref:Uncharacterized protein n=1 Tax=Dendronalium phyllosphericum CENA369 TaxID=1725256 RepID=A0A8J7I585_9NOST|nr:hypothetical protein [Dendronalium phyllosphericum]MBH8574013.1 hypothetical protein [Dendronalium phyllosphericum CENA369]